MAIYIDRNAPESGIASLLAMQGRGGDTELVHMTKPEVKMLMNTGLMSLNNETGLPEFFKGKDFLKFALPLAAGIAFPALLGPALGSSLGIGALGGSALAGGLGTAAAGMLTGQDPADALMSGLLSGGMSYGLGSAFPQTFGVGGGEGSNLLTQAQMEAAVPTSYQPSVSDTISQMHPSVYNQSAAVASYGGLGPNATFNKVPFLGPAGSITSPPPLPVAKPAAPFLGPAGSITSPPPLPVAKQAYGGLGTNATFNKAPFLGPAGDIPSPVRIGPLRPDPLPTTPFAPQGGGDMMEALDPFYREFPEPVPFAPRGGGRGIMEALDPFHVDVGIGPSPSDGRIGPLRPDPLPSGMRIGPLRPDPLPPVGDEYWPLGSDSKQFAPSGYDRYSSKPTWFQDGKSVASEEGWKTASIGPESWKRPTNINQESLQESVTSYGGLGPEPTFNQRPYSGPAGKLPESLGEGLTFKDPSFSRFDKSSAPSLAEAATVTEKSWTDRFKEKLPQSLGEFGERVWSKDSMLPAVSSLGTGLLTGAFDEEVEEQTIEIGGKSYTPRELEYTYNLAPNQLEGLSASEIRALLEKGNLGKFYEQPSSGEGVFRPVAQGGLIGLADGGNPDFEGQVTGQGHGMQDNVLMPIKEKGGIAAVSPDEYVVPADVMSMIGNGSADSGAKAMDSFIADFRTMKYGRPEQPPEINPKGALQSLMKT